MSHWQYLDHAEPVFTARSALPTYVPPLVPEPTRAPRVVALAVTACFFVPVVAQAQTPRGWEPLTAEPIRPPHLLLHQTGAERPILPAPRQIDWFAPLAEPARVRPPLLVGTGAERPVTFVRHARGVEWLPALSEPPRAKPWLVLGTGAERPLALVRYAKGIEWLPPLAEPQFLRHRLLPEESFVPLVAPAPAVSIGWFQPLSEPPRSPRRVLDPFTIAAPVFPIPRAAAAFWYPQMWDGIPLPIPVVALLVQMGVVPAEIIPTPPAVAPDQPIVGLGHPKSFSTKPELGGGSW